MNDEKTHSVNSQNSPISENRNAWGKNMAQFKSWQNLNQIVYSYVNRLILIKMHQVSHTFLYAFITFSSLCHYTYTIHSYLHSFSFGQYWKFEIHFPFYKTHWHLVVYPFLNANMQYLYNFFSISHCAHSLWPFK
jgi:hypothetical protein